MRHTDDNDVKRAGVPYDPVNDCEAYDVPRSNAESTEDRRPDLVITNDEYELTDNLIDALRTADELYQRGGKLVRINVDERPIDGLRNSEGTPRIETFPTASLRELSTKYVRWVGNKNVAKKGEEEKWERVPRAPHQPAINALAARGKWKGIRPLEAIVEIPILRQDGSILDRPGYDPATGLVFMPSLDFGTIPSHPTINDARRALNELYEVVADFPFANGAPYKAAWLSAFLTMLARHAIGGCVPLFLVDSNIRGAGKGLCVDTIAIPVTGRPMPITIYADTDAEVRKLITSLVLRGVALTAFDNVATDFGCPALDAAITGTTWSDRLLGTNDTTPSLPQKIVFFATGNNLSLSGDVPRRLIHVRLEATEARPEQRSGFKHPDLRNWMLRERARLVRAGLTILRAFFVAGCPSSLSPLGSFEAWSKLVRDCVVWLGEGDPVETQRKLADTADPVEGALYMMIEALAPTAGNAGLSAAQLIEMSAKPRGPTMEDSHPALRAAIAELCPTRDNLPPSAKSLGKRLSGLRARRITDGRYIDKLDIHGTAYWRVRDSKGEGNGE